MNRVRGNADLTAKQAHPGGGMCSKLLFMCGHKASSTGGQMRGRVPMRCAACVGAGKVA